MTLLPFIKRSPFLKRNSQNLTGYLRIITLTIKKNKLSKPNITKYLIYQYFNTSLL